MDGLRTVHVRVEGRVQGVGYRAWVECTARTMSINGWVRNRRDSSVEMVLQGTPERVAKMLQRCARGPPDARVSIVEILGEGGDAYDRFKVLPTA
ncbi:MAG: acylphosphatase [Proteobacteria bacterium]|nr:acylphosphatase [Pseudomonadota bacterium]